ncbi:pilus assembly protein PilP [Pseudomonas fluorescens]|uniref:pilus assembly protein PilP n=1 Tax=Pseudomonas fluorescens TaxID=294 RepID=UPI0020C5ADDA|nr:pilus assembly protein PilP [Pseudomonas fluorescens]UTL91479.1 pilus assembly protein PilP [Pseudomonas fluorescens]
MNLLHKGDWLAVIERSRLARCVLPFAIGLIVVGFGCLFRLPYWLQLQEQERARHVRLLQVHETKAAEVLALSQMRTGLDAARQLLQDARWRLAAGADMSDLLDQLAASGHAQGLHFERLDVLDEVTRQPGYWQTSLDVQVVGRYSGLRMWLDDWLGQVRLLRAEALWLAPAQDRPGLLRLGMRVHAYQADGEVPEPLTLADTPARGEMQPVVLDPFSEWATRIAQAGLASVPLAQLQMVGSLQRGPQREALLSAAGRLYRVRPGDRLGRDGGVVVEVGERQLNVRERLFLGGVWRERTVMLTLRKSVTMEARDGDEMAIEGYDGGASHQSVVHGSALSG